MKRFSRRWTFGALAAAALAAALAGCAIPTQTPQPRLAEAPEVAWQTYRADSGFQFRYPLETYSVRDGNAASPDVIFPGVKVVEPNDSFLYRAPRQQVFRISIAARVNERGLTLKDAEALLTQNAFFTYGPDALAGKSILTTTLGGAPALRVDDVATGPNDLTAQLVAVQGGFIYDVVVEPHAPTGNQAVLFETGAPSPANRALVERILATIELENLSAREPAAASPLAGDEPLAAGNMRLLLRGWLGEAAADARLVEVREVEFSDACFGAGYPYESCAQVITPGYEMTFEVDGGRYTFRTDPEAGRYRLIAAPPPDIGETVISWSGDTGAEIGGCASAEIGTRAVAFGDCGGQRMTGRFVNESNRDLLDQHVARFATFRAQTPAGTIVFTGQGEQMPTPADERAVAELAQLMFMEARSGRAGASWATAISLRQETAPGRTPMCVSVEMTGRAYVSPCAADAPLKAAFLNPGGLAQLYRWVDELQLYDEATTERAVTTQIVFGGRGTREAAIEERRAIRDFAEGLIGEGRDLHPELNAGRVRIALPLILPEGLNWNPQASSAEDRAFSARAEDPANPQWRWVEVRGSLDAFPAPPDPGTAVTLRGQNGMAHNFGEGHVVMWQEDGTHFAVWSSFGLTETVEIAGGLVPMPIEQFEGVMTEDQMWTCRARSDTTDR